MGANEGRRKAAMAAAGRSAERERAHGAVRALGAMALAALLALVPLAAVAPEPALADGAFASGSGTAADPYVIQTASQLEAFRDAVNAGTSYDGQTIQLAADLDISGAAWKPIGMGVRSGSGTASGATPFKGTFDGAGHTVSGLTITATANAGEALGLFGIVQGGMVENLKLANVSVKVNSSELAGGAVGLAIGSSTISDVEVSGEVAGAAGIGGVVGRMTDTGTITGCTNHATVSATGTGNAGGIVGAAYYTTADGKMAISDCSNDGAISGTQAIGGIAGLSSAFASGCTNSGAVTASNYSVGGIVGEQKNYGSIERCANSGAVANSSTSGYGTGGIVGWVRYDGAAPAYAASAPVAIVDNANTASVKGGNDAGGIVGCLYDAGTVTGNDNQAATLTSSRFAGGIVGNLQSSGTALPAGVTEGSEVVNNVSTTPLDSIDAALKGQFAYDNDPSKFTVADNGTAWVAEADGTRFATLPRALAVAGDGGTVKLLADIPDAATIEQSSGGTATIDLDGHKLAFAEAPALKVAAGTLAITGSGAVLTEGDGLDSLVSLVPSGTEVATLSLHGGTYKQDVLPYVAKGYAELVLHDPVDGARYEVLPADQALDGAAASVTDDGKTTYYEDLDDAKAALANEPGATLTVLPAKPAADSTTTAGGKPGDGTTSQVGASAAAGVNQTGDNAAAPIAAAVAVAAAALLALLRKRSLS